jgi:hypothetical protein
MGRHSAVMRRLCLGFVTRHCMAGAWGGRAMPPHDGTLPAGDDAG